MARIQTSPIITSIKGKLGNSVFQTGKSGIILREKVKPNDRKTEDQIKARIRLHAIKSFWQNLTSAQRNTWIALSDFMKQKQKNDATRILSPYNLFMQSNIVRNLVFNTEQLTTSLDVPTVLGYNTEIDYPINPSFTWLVDTSITGGTATTAFFISKPYRQSATIPNSAVRYATYFDENFQSRNIADFYTNKFGILPVSGQKVRIKLIAFYEDDGWIGTSFYMDVIIE